MSFCAYVVYATSNPTSLLVTGKDKNYNNIEMRWRRDAFGQSTIGFEVGKLLP